MLFHRISIICFIMTVTVLFPRHGHAYPGLIRRSLDTGPEVGDDQNIIGTG